MNDPYITSVKEDELLSTQRNPHGSLYSQGVGVEENSPQLNENFNRVAL